MLFSIPNFIPAIPELWVLGMTCVVLLIDLFAKTNKNVLVYVFSQLTMIVALILTIALWPKQPMLTFNDSFILDHLASVLNIFIYLCSFFVFVYSRDYLHEWSMPIGEYYILSLFSILGMMVLVSAHSLLTLYLGIEILSLPIYAMVAIKRDARRCSEAAMKYFILGALASGMLLYGMSMLYGATASLDIANIASVIDHVPNDQRLMLMLGMVFVLCGMVFKFGAVPFHMWVPDVYTGAPSSVTLFISAAPKIAALGMTLRILMTTLPQLQPQWQQILIIVSILSMAIGNFAAIVQNDLKRMLAYSSIAHMGYMVLGLIAGKEVGYGAALFYMLNYALMSAGAFGIIAFMSKYGRGEATQIDFYRGLNSRNPWLALIMLILMFSMAGIPPTVGFFAKLGVLQALIQMNLTWLAAVAILFAVVGAYYYLRVVKVMYFEDPEDYTAFILANDVRFVISINGLIVLLLGLFPGALFALCHAAF